MKWYCLSSVARTVLLIGRLSPHRDTNQALHWLIIDREYNVYDVNLDEMASINGGGGLDPSLSGGWYRSAFYDK